MRLTDQWTRAVDAALHAGGFDPPVIAPTPRETAAREGSTSLYRLRPVGAGSSEESLAPLVLVPSLINRWWVLDLCSGHSIAASMGALGRPVYALDWGVFDDAERGTGWGDLCARLGRMLEIVRRDTGHARAHLAGFSIGGTLSLTHACLAGGAGLASLTLLAAPVDFARAGSIARWVDARWFDPRLVTATGNVPPWGVLSGFAALQPRVFASEALVAQKALLLERPRDPGPRRARHLRLALARWLYDGVPFPARAYETVVRSLYQRNELWNGSLDVGGQRASLEGVRGLPVLAVTARDDVICPPAATLAINERGADAARDALSLTGTHVSGVVGERADTELALPWRAWLAKRG